MIVTTVTMVLPDDWQPGLDGGAHRSGLEPYPLIGVVEVDACSRIQTSTPEAFRRLAAELLAVAAEMDTIPAPNNRVLPSHDYWAGTRR